jgi:hypothetical protein
MARVGQVALDIDRAIVEEPLAFRDCPLERRRNRIRPDGDAKALAAAARRRLDGDRKADRPSLARGPSNSSPLGCGRLYLDRQPVRSFDLRKREARFDRGDAGEPGQLLLEKALIGVQIANHDA